MQFRKMSGCIRQRSVYEQALCRACSGLIDLNEFRGLSGLAARKGGIRGNTDHHRKNSKNRARKISVKTNTHQ